MEENQKNNTRPHPIWIEAAETILQMVQEKGFGFLISWDELRQMLDLDSYGNKLMTHAEYSRAQLETLNRVDALRKELLFNYQIYLDNQIGQGYRVVTPDEQVSVSFKKSWTRMRRQLSTALAIITNVHRQRLSDNGRQAMDQNLSRTLFVKKAFDKRKLPTIKLHKEIAEKNE